MSVKSLVNDPDFQALSPQEKQSALSGVDPDFKNIGVNEVEGVVSGIKAQDKQSSKINLPTLNELAAMGNRGISSLAKGTLESLMPPTTKESLKRQISPNPGQYGVLKTLQDAGQKITNSADSAVQNLPPSVQKAYAMRPGDLTPLSFAQQIGTVPIAEGAGVVAGKVLKPILSPIGKGIANVMERTSGLTYKTPGVLADAFNDSTLRGAPGLDEVRPAYKAAKEAAGGVKNLVSGEEAPALVQHREIIDKALEMAKAGKLNPAEAQTARMSVDALGSSGSYSEDSIRGLRSFFDKIAKTSKEIKAGDVAYQRGIKADALREAFPVNKGGGTSIMKLVTGLGATKFLGPAGIAADAALFSPAVQGYLATGAGMATRALKNPAVADVIGNSLREALQSRRKK